MLLLQFLIIHLKIFFSDFDDRQDVSLLIGLDEEGSFDQLYEVLSKDGIVVTQLGRSPQSYDSPSRHFKNNEIISYLVEQGYMQSAFQYESVSLLSSFLVTII